MLAASFLASYAAHAAVIATIHLSAAPQNVTIPLLVLAIAHSFYFALWTRGDDWVAAVRSFRGHSADPSVAMAWTAQLIKLAQVAAVVGFLAQSGALSDSGAAWSWGDALSLTHLARSLVSQGPVRFVVFTGMLAVGQTLNGAILKAIGIRGVYYGCKFGHTVPWSTQFPFNVPTIRHPQYVGAILTLLGGGGLLWSDRTSAAGIELIVGVWSAFYVGTGVVEDFW